MNRAFLCGLLLTSVVQCVAAADSDLLIISGNSSKNDQQSTSSTTAEQLNEAQLVLVSSSTHLSDWRKAHAQIEQQLQTLLSQSNAISESLKRLKSAESRCKSAAGNTKKACVDLLGNLEMDLYTSFPAVGDMQTQLFSKNPLEEIENPTPYAVRQAIIGAIAHWQTYAPDSCIDTSGQVWKASEISEKYELICKQLGYSSDTAGGLVMHGLEKDLSISEKDINSVRDEESLYPNMTSAGDQNSLPDFWSSEVFSACSVLSQIGRHFTSSRLVYYPILQDEPRWVQPLYFAPLNPEDFREQCIVAKPSQQEITQLYFKIRSEYPDFVYLDSWTKGYDQRQTMCDKTVQTICGNTYTIKSQRILSYETVMCKIKDVTAEDVKNQLVAIPSEAEKLKQSQLIDQMQVCDEAEKAGYEFVYVKPIVERGCKPERD